MKLLAFTIGGQKIGIDIKSWNNTMLSGHTAFMTIADTGSTPTNYSDISSVDNWDSFGWNIGLTPAQIKTEIVKLIPGTPTLAQYDILSNYMNVGINGMTKVGDTAMLGSILTGSTVLTGVTSSYGSYYQYAASLSATTTNSTTGVTKVKMITTNLLPGTYKISVCWIWNRSTATSDALHDVLVNGVAVGHYMSGRMQVNTEYRPAYRVLFLQLSGVNTIDFRHYGSTPQQTTTTTDASIELIRVK